MSKRMYDTGIVQQSWYMELTPRQKALWWQLHAMMDNAGVFEINDKMLEVMFGDKVTRREIFNSFGNRVQPVPDHPDKGVFVDYVAWTNPRGVSKQSPSQRSIIARLAELGLSVEALNKMSRKKVAVAPPEPEDGDGDGDADEPEPKKRRRKFAKPTVEEVAAYIREIGAKIDAHGFVDYYTSSASPDGAWLVGNRPMRDWRAAVRNWERMRKEWGDNGNGGSKHATNWRGGDIGGSEGLL